MITVSSWIFLSDSRLKIKETTHGVKSYSVDGVTVFWWRVAAGTGVTLVIAWWLWLASVDDPLWYTPLFYALILQQNNALACY